MIFFVRSLAVYPGSFDPPTLGHMDVIERASKLVDNLIVAVGKNSSKKPLLTVEDRIAVLTQCCSHLRNVQCESFEGMLVEYAHKVGAKSLIRGLRATADFEYEFQMAMVNRRLAPDIETMFLMTTWEHSYLSSSIVREVAQLGGDYSGMVPKPVSAMLDQLKTGKIGSS